MNRRGFIGAIVAATSVSRSLSTAPLQPTDNAFDPEYVLGYPNGATPRTGGDGAYRYHWTGLKAHQDWSWRVGQWLAWPTPDPDGVYRYSPDRHPPFLYVNVPGFVGGVYQLGQTFNITARERFIIHETPKDQVHAWIAEGEHYLRELMDGYKDRLASTVPSSLYHFPMDAADRGCMALNL